MKAILDVTTSIKLFKDASEEGIKDSLLEAYLLRASLLEQMEDFQSSLVDCQKIRSTWTNSQQVRHALP